MKHVINRIHKRTTEYSHPSQATTIANSLELLSSGIYTEEERFVFELLQNAVDSYDEATAGLNVKIVVGNGRLIFMHNGSPFSERDLEGLCDIGNGNKMSDAKKIGYKGIGFKSVFMHSKRVTVITDGTCFRFDEEACRELAVSRGKEYKDVKMPWQIIPIISEIPVGMNYDGYSVITILEVSNTEKLLKKVEKLLSDARFLLFLKVANLRVSLFDGETEILSLSKTQEKNILTLAKNNVAQSHWLMFAKDVKIPSDVKEDLIHDTKTPTKLKDSDSVEISFAIALDDEGHILPLKDAVVYTYLPTSFSFGFEFVVNANFITDAGRQQLIKDCEWNKFIFSQIPSLFLNWIKDEVAPNHSDWYRVLLPVKKENDDLTLSYQYSLSSSLTSIPFIRTRKATNVLLNEALFDSVGISEFLPEKVINLFITTEISSHANYNTIVNPTCGEALKKYGINNINRHGINLLVEKASKYLSKLTMEEMNLFLSWLRKYCATQDGAFIRKVSETALLPDEDGGLIEPLRLFFPSDFKENNDIAKDSHIINRNLYGLMDSPTKDWLKNIGVHEMNTLSIIENILCSDGYINKENTVKVIQFIFDSNLKKPIWEEIPMSKLQNLKVLTKGGKLVNISDVFLDSAYGTELSLPIIDSEDIFISTNYIRKKDNILEWQLFFRKLGANIDFFIGRRTFGEGSKMYSELYPYIEYCSNHETNYGYRIHTCGYFVHRYISAQLPPLINLWGKYEWAKLIWSRVFTKPISLTRESDYIAGHTGWNYYAYGYLKDNIEGHRYLGKYLIQYLTEKRSILPGSDGKLHQVSDLLPPTEYNKAIAGEYYPILNINGSIDNSWLSLLSFKSTLSLIDLLNILEKISLDNSSEKIRTNLDRISEIYNRIADGGYNFTVGSSDFNTLRSWGKTHKILSADKKFEYPCDLCLISSRLSGVELDNQVYHRKNQENNRFADLMIALGVNMINDHRVEGLDDAIPQNSIKEELQKKLDFFTALSLGDKYTLSDWAEAKDKMREAIAKINFYNVPSIHVIYGTQSIEKPVYVRDTNLYFVGKFGLAIQELLHVDIVRLLGLHANDRSMFLTLLRMSDYDEMIEYLQLKGYDTELITKPQLPEEVEANPAPIMQGEDAPYGGLTTEQMRDALIEAKEAVLSQLEIDGYDISNYHWDGWTCIDGVKKGDIEYPLVIRSNRSGSNIRLNPNDWNQLMRPNAMFAMNTSDGIGTLRLKDILKSRENITIRFKSDNLDNMDHISKIADLLAYFRGIQFDFESYVRPTISRWQSFMAPELETGEQAVANTSIPLPE